MKKNRGQKSRDTAPLKYNIFNFFTRQPRMKFQIMQKTNSNNYQMIVIVLAITGTI